jgi:acetyl-CoA carboxylase beta subunit
MLTIKRKYIINEDDKKVAVQLDIKTFEKIERLLDDYVLAESIKSNKATDRLTVNEAKAYYQKLKKK